MAVADADFALMGQHDALNDGQAQAVASQLAQLVLRQSVEGLQHALSLALRNAGAVIVHTQYLHAVFAAGLDQDLAMAVALGIAQQIVQRAREQAQITVK